ncbi:MAG TPA: group III truncated hemoglobin [Mycobacterium sp.]|nr:group III truncated hemoglobin [Mycobacterium sp.]
MADEAREAIPLADLATRADVDAVLRQFYGQVLVDDVLKEPFAEIRKKGLESHLPVMCDFWETVLFRAGLYHRRIVQAHQPVHKRNTLSANHFLRWLSLWNTTVDQMYSGPTADHAKVQAARIAWAMHRRLTGHNADELDGLVVRRARHGKAYHH